MKEVDTIGVIITGLLTLNGFFLIRFWYLVDEMRRDIKHFLQREAAKNEKLENISENVTDIKQTVNSHDKRLNHLEIEIIKLQN